jgi:hypothetical protein
VALADHRHADRESGSVPGPAHDPADDGSAGFDRAGVTDRVNNFALPAGDGFRDIDQPIPLNIAQDHGVPQ